MTETTNVAEKLNEYFHHAAQWYLETTNSTSN